MGLPVRKKPISPQRIPPPRTTSHEPIKFNRQQLVFTLCKSFSAWEKNISPYRIHKTDGGFFYDGVFDGKNFSLHKHLLNLQLHYIIEDDAWNIHATAQSAISIRTTIFFLNIRKSGIVEFDERTPESIIIPTSNKREIENLTDRILMKLKDTFTRLEPKGAGMASVFPLSPDQVTRQAAITDFANRGYKIVSRATTRSRIFSPLGLLAALFLVFFARFFAGQSQALMESNPESIHSGALDKESSKEPILSFDAQPSGRHAYLRSGVGVEILPSTCGLSKSSEITRETLSEKGSRTITAKIADGVFVSDIPSIVGGKTLGVSGNTITYAVSDNPIPQIANMELSTFRNQAPKLYGKNLYKTLTTPEITLEQVAKLDPQIAADWGNLIKEVQPLSVIEAAEKIRGHIVYGSRFTYHYYERLAEKMNFLHVNILSSISLCGGDAYINMAFENKGGVCGEMSRVGLNLERMAGIPVILTKGFAVQNGLVTTATAHAYVEEVFPMAEGEYYGNPLEFSESKTFPQH